MSQKCSDNFDEILQIKNKRMFFFSSLRNEISLQTSIHWEMVKDKKIYLIKSECFLTCRKKM